MFEENQQQSNSTRLSTYSTTIGTTTTTIGTTTTTLAWKIFQKIPDENYERSFSLNLLTISAPKDIFYNLFAILTINREASNNVFYFLMSV